MKALRKKDIDYLARLKDGRRSARPILRIALLALPFVPVSYTHLPLPAGWTSWGPTPAPPP